MNARVAKLEQESHDVEMAILTHWSPSRDPRVIDARQSTSPIMDAFPTDLSGEKCFRSSKVNVWAFGHTHDNVDFCIERDGGAGPLRLVANQSGSYFTRATGFGRERLLSCEVF